MEIHSEGMSDVSLCGVRLFLRTKKDRSLRQFLQKRILACAKSL